MTNTLRRNGWCWADGHLIRCMRVVPAGPSQWAMVVIAVPRLLAVVMIAPARRAAATRRGSRSAASCGDAWPLTN